MTLSMGEKIKIILGRRNMTIAELANKLKSSPQNFTNKLKRDNFNEKELIEIAEKLNCDFCGSFKFKETGEEI